MQQPTPSTDRPTGYLARPGNRQDSKHPRPLTPSQQLDNHISLMEFTNHRQKLVGEAMRGVQQMTSHDESLGTVDPNDLAALFGVLGEFLRMLCDEHNANILQLRQAKGKLVASAAA